MTIVVVVGTDTEVGKTYVSCRAIEAIRAAGRDVVAVKPVESGCTGEGEDAALLAAATGQAEPTAALDRLPVPVTPALAADLAGVALKPSSWIAAIRALDDKHEIVIVETAGGVLSPMTWSYNAIDLITQLGASAVLISANRLGTINHTMLTLRAMDTARLDTIGVVLTDVAATDDATATNLDVLRRLDPRPMTTVVRNGDAAVVAQWILLHADGHHD